MSSSSDASAPPARGGLRTFCHFFFFFTATEADPGPEGTVPARDFALLTRTPSFRLAPFFPVQNTGSPFPTFSSISPPSVQVLSTALTYWRSPKLAVPFQTEEFKPPRKACLRVCGQASPFQNTRREGPKVRTFPIPLLLNSFWSV